ncbi:MAG TPA: hypothetical protein VFX49_10940 [Chloroflexota bacterium]|nr:hypothetical protein [Chloroflexota bacterium]
MQAVPLGFFLFLVELAAGGLIVTALLDWDGEVSGGFLFLNGIFMLGAAGAGIWLRAVLPAGRLVPAAAGRSALELELPAWGGFAVLGAVYLILVRLDRRLPARVAGALMSLAGVGALLISALAYTPEGGGLQRALSFGAGAMALGSVWSGMMLGHWYLVTPLLAPRPLLRLNALMAASLALLGAVALLDRPAAGANEGPAEWIYWLRLGAGVALSLALALPIWRTARVRSMMSATGLLYVALGLVLSGEIMARVLDFLR